MVTELGGKSRLEEPRHFFGATNDTKPTGDDVTNGSTYKETDGEHRLWRYDKASRSWGVDTHSGGGGGGGDEDIATDADIEGVIDDIWPDTPIG